MSEPGGPELDVGNPEQTKQTFKNPIDATNAWLDARSRLSKKDRRNQVGRVIGPLSLALPLYVSAFDSFQTHDIPRAIAEAGLGMYFLFSAKDSLKT